MAQNSKYIKSFFILILLSYVSIGSVHSQSSTKPNIILLMSDDHRADAIGYKGNPDVITPNIDKLAHEGIIFNRHYASSPICMNSRATTMTGMPEYMTGTGFHHGGMTRDIWNNSYVVKLKDAGYITGFAGKFGFGVFDNETDAGTENINAWKSEDSKPISDFDAWWGFNGGGNYITAKDKYLEHLADSFPHVSKALGFVGTKFIEEHASQANPFCLTMWFKAPHKPFEPDSAYDHLFKGRSYQYPENYGMEANQHFSWQAVSGRQYNQFTDHWAPDSNYQESIRKYYQLIYGMDVAIGMLLDELEKQGIADNTIIIYTSDNGYFAGSHGFQGKTLCYEEAANIPMVVYDPRNSNMGQNKEVNSITSNEDIAPTIMELAGVSVPENITGKSLLPILDNPEKSLRKSLPLVNVFRDNDACQALAVVTEEYKYVYWGYETEDSISFPNDNSIKIKYEASEELYNLSNDKLEMNDLAKDTNFLRELIEVRSIYDSCYEHWVENCVQRNGYPDYDTLFKRKFGFDSLPPVDTVPVDTVPSDTSGSGVSGIDRKLASKEDILVYPNPVQNYFTLANVPANNYSVEIYAITGRKVFERRIISSETVTVNLPVMTEGMYILQIKESDTNKILKTQLLRITN